MSKIKEPAIAYSTTQKTRPGEPLPSPKDAVTKLLKNLKDDVSYEDIMYEIYVLEKIERGLRDIEQGNVFSHEEVKASLKKWLK
ncbi:MAG: hypothetical protein EPO24_05680 [Bacteroidetes bacterium]|nr:MAG: hypothetical protein EPO24_05680 [Bacteroidota bacterium]